MPRPLPPPTRPLTFEGKKVVGRGVVPVVEVAVRIWLPRLGLGAVLCRGFELDGTLRPSFERVEPRQDRAWFGHRDGISETRESASR